MENATLAIAQRVSRVAYADLNAETIAMEMVFGDLELVDIAGPIVHHGEFIPQLQDPARWRPDSRRLALGLTLFAAGLFQKCVIADTSPRAIISATRKYSVSGALSPPSSRGRQSRCTFVADGYG